jgi:hypothetical protein
MSIKRWIRDWLLNEGDALRASRAPEVEVRPDDQVQVQINQAMNGKVLSIRSYKPTNTKHSDWVNELYVVPEGESLTEAVTFMLLAKGLK